MRASTHLEAGRAYRTSELGQFSTNPTRLARELVDQGRLRRAAHGLYYVPAQTRFGAAPPKDDELLRAFFKEGPFLVTGPPRWNALGLGATAMFSSTLVYNTRYSREVTLAGRRFLLRRVNFPEDAPVEYFVVDLLRHHRMAGAALSELEARLKATLAGGRWNRDRLRKLAERYGTKTTLALVDRCLAATAEAP